MATTDEDGATVTLVAADDHRLFLEGLKSLLQQLDGCRLVAICDNGQDLLERVECWTPDIVLLDISMPGPPAERIVELLRERHPRCRVIAVTMYLDRVLADELFARGLAGYVSKADAFDELSEAIGVIRRGGVYVSPALESIASTSASTDDACLSAREIEVLRQAAGGKSNQEIADVLTISERTVRFHLNNCCTKLRAKSRAHVIALAMAEKLIHVDRVER